MNSNYTKYLNQNDENISLKRLSKSFSSRWYYFIIFLSLSIGLGLLYIQSTPSKYVLKGLILVSEDESSNLNSANFLLGNSALFSNKSNIENEIGILTSRSLISETVDNLDFQVEYHRKDFLKEVELYSSSPFFVTIDSSAYNIINVPCKVVILSETEYYIEVESKNFSLHTIDRTKEDLTKNEDFIFQDTLKFGIPSPHPYLNFTVQKNKSLKLYFVD